MNDSSDHEWDVAAVLRESGHLPVELEFEVANHKFISALANCNEMMELPTKYGTLKLEVISLEFGWYMRAAHDNAFTIFGIVENTNTYVRVILYDENSRCWVEHVATLQKPLYMKMKPVVMGFDMQYGGEEEYES